MKLHEDTEAVKQIFDYFRNVAIAALLISATKWTTAQLSHEDTVTVVMHAIATVLLLLVGIGLFIVNFRHGQFQLGKRIPHLAVTGYSGDSWPFYLHPVFSTGVRSIRAECLGGGYCPYE